MPDTINLLTENVANKIAAGEVVLRPSSVVKELLENSIDAGSQEIRLYVNDGGKSLIKVIDNGCGMSDIDARMCFERHATSKIRVEDDLLNIRTLGFRGEALPSVAAVSHVELKTRTIGEELGTLVSIEGSKLITHEPCQCQEGTSVTVRHLFFNLPARKNFLKSTNAEMRHVVDEFLRIALGHPSVFMGLYHNDRELYHIEPSNLRKRIVAVFGKNYNERLVPVDESTELLKITGFIGKPGHAKKTRGEQFFVVNGRFIRSPYMHHAVLNAYDDIIPQGQYPLYVLQFHVDSSRIDINVHPTKQEIKFEDEKVIYAILSAAVKKALSQFSVAPSIDFDLEQSIEQLSAISAPIPTEVHSGPGHTVDWSPISRGDKTITIQSDWPDKKEAEEETHEPSESVPYQLHRKYMLAPVKNGLLLIDQQAAHERILFDKFKFLMETNKAACQQLLFPQNMELSHNDFTIAQEIIDDINALGFDVKVFGMDSLIIHGVPADIEVGQPSELIDQLLDQFKDNNSNLKLEPRDNLALALAYRAGIKSGRKLSREEMQQLIDELFACTNFQKSPSGKTILVKFTNDDLETVFAKKS